MTAKPSAAGAQACRLVTFLGTGRFNEKTALAGLIHPGCDDVPIYPVPANPEWRWLGDGPLPDDVHLPIRGERGGVERVIDAGVAPEVNSAAAEVIVNPVFKPLIWKPDWKGGVKPQT